MTNREYLEGLDKIELIKWIIYKLDYIKEKCESDMQFEWWLNYKHEWEDEV